MRLRALHLGYLLICLSVIFAPLGSEHAHLGFEAHGHHEHVHAHGGHHHDAHDADVVDLSDQPLVSLWSAPAPAWIASFFVLVLICAAPLTSGFLRRELFRDTEPINRAAVWQPPPRGPPLTIQLT
ncbi:MAG: hypothetical protein ABIT61_05715 [Steroidobacteraceae bacterium]